MGGLSLIFGMLVGLSLGLTGGGGAIFAVPLLVYGLGISTQEAVMISLAAVGSISFAGFLIHWKQGLVDLRTGTLFALSGMLGAPVGTWIVRQMSETVLLLLFAALMVTVAIRLWNQAGRQSNECQTRLGCRRDPVGELVLTPCCAMLLVLVGLATGILSGLFGVGGGFIIVPALVLLTNMPIHGAVGTSLLVIVLISLSGIGSSFWSGQNLSLVTTIWFVGGGIIGLSGGQFTGRRLSGSALQKVFAGAILAVAAFITVRNWEPFIKPDAIRSRQENSRSF